MSTKRTASKARHKKVAQTGWRPPNSRLVVIGFAGRDKHHRASWLCRCDCGAEIPVRQDALLNGDTRSCGCLQREVAAKMGSDFRKTHKGIHSLGFKHGGWLGKRRSPEYRSWANMVSRCTNPNRIGWKNYGGAGVQVCDRWLGENGFTNFLADVGKRPERTELGRYLDTGNYEPANCAWQTRKEQIGERRGKEAMLALRAHHRDSNNQNVDVLVSGGGSIFLLRPMSDAARAWIDEHIGSDNGFQPYYPTVVCEHRYVADIVAGMQGDGLAVSA